MNTMTWLQDGAAWAWHTSLVMAVPGIILIAFGRWRGFSAKWRMFFAAALLLRLLLPSVPELPWHPAALLEQTFTVAPPVSQQRGQDDAVLPWPEEMAASLAEESVAPVSVTHHLTRAVSWQGVLAGVWALGVIGVIGWLVGSHWLIRRWVSRQSVAPDAHVVRLFQWCCERMEMPRRIGLTAMPHIATAAVCGWLRPMVLVPMDLRQTHTDDEIRGILLHELAHVRRCDVLWSWLGLAACALHWFNPIAWLTLRRYHADRELDCDRMALAKLTAPQQNAYAPALLKALEGAVFSTPAALTPFFRNKHEIHTRILTIMKPSKSLAARLAALTMIPALSILTLTTAGADEEKKPGITEETPAKLRDGEAIKKGPRDGEVKKEGARDGEARKEGARDGEVKKQGPRDGEVKKEGARDGEIKKQAARDGEGTTKAPREGERIKKTAETEKNGKALVLRVVGNGESVLVDGQTIAANTLRGYLSEQVDGGTTIVVEAEDNVPYRAVLNVLDAARDSGARGAKLSMDQRPRESEKKTGPSDGDGDKKAGPRDGEASAGGSALYQRLTARSETFRKHVRDEVAKRAARDGDKPKADPEG